MADEQILSREDYTRRIMASMFGTPAAEVTVLCNHDAALRAQVAGLEAGIAQAAHHRDCTITGLVCKNCDKLFREHGIATDACPDKNSVFEEVRGCNCYLSTLSDPIARGKELLEKAQRYDDLMQYFADNRNGSTNALYSRLEQELKRLKGESK